MASKSKAALAPGGSGSGNIGQGSSSRQAGGGQHGHHSKLGMTLTATLLDEVRIVYWCAILPTVVAVLLLAWLGDTSPWMSILMVYDFFHMLYEEDWEITSMELTDLSARFIMQAVLYGANFILAMMVKSAFDLHHPFFVSQHPTSIWAEEIMYEYLNMAHEMACIRVIFYGVVHVGFGLVYLLTKAL